MTMAEVSVYPLRRHEIGSVIDEVVEAFCRPGLGVRMGEMSTLVWGEEGVVFAALREGFRRAAARGDAVMVVKLSNACPPPSEAADGG
jgi:uncharacterized protein YqgV (UPF0045/DUF77 family)